MYAQLIKDYISKIQKGEIIDVRAVPIEVRNNPEIARAERKVGIRTTKYSGFDVIRQNFFVVEIVKRVSFGQISYREQRTVFESFDAYYAFLDGDIYDKACYYSFYFDEALIRKYSIDTSRIFYESFIQENVSSIMPSAYVNNMKSYEEKENQKKRIIQWIKKYNACETVDDLIKVDKNHSKSADNTNTIFFLWNYINANGEKAMKPILDFVGAMGPSSKQMEYALAFVFGFENVSANYRYSYWAKSTNSSHNTEYRREIQNIKEQHIEPVIDKFFDSETHFFCIRKAYTYKTIIPLYQRVSPLTAYVYEYYDNAQDFIMALDGDVSDCDFSNYLSSAIDFNMLKTNESTIEPVLDIESYRKTVETKYNAVNDSFDVLISWTDDAQNTIYTENRSFMYIHDCLKYVNYDLTDADFVQCEGLKFLRDYSSINLTNAKLVPEVRNRIGYEEVQQYDFSSDIDNAPVDYLKENETTTAVKLYSNNYVPMKPEMDSLQDNKVYYISDLHLPHRLDKHKAVSEADVYYWIHHIAMGIVRDICEYSYLEHERKHILLIGGDISSNIEIFEKFVEELRACFNKYSLECIVIFVLGNHELWHHKNQSIQQIVKEYRDILKRYDMYLLQNELLLIEDYNISIIEEDEICVDNKADILSKARKSRLTIFGGLGFAGYNEEFNAEAKHIYLDSLGREEEIQETKRFERLYYDIKSIFKGKNIIIFTHMPLSDWCSYREYENGFVYVSGHSHLNYFYDDGDRRIYCDNQIGYYNELIRPKFFLMDSTYDYFGSYVDGVHSITKEDYLNFYRGKNIECNYNRTVVTLYMLKKNGYYCFIYMNKDGELCILNKGQSNKLTYSTDIYYYYNHMLEEIEYLSGPLPQYSHFQKNISDEIKKFGGTGRIHGAIIDIDGDFDGWGGIAFNHVFVNPFDYSITPYFAYDMEAKYVYPSISALLKDKCPRLYQNYLALLEDAENKNAIIIKNNMELDTVDMEPKYEPSKEIYKINRELHKMQKLEHNILCTWVREFNVLG